MLKLKDNVEMRINHISNYFMEKQSNLKLEYEAGQFLKPRSKEPIMPKWLLEDIYLRENNIYSEVLYMLRPLKDLVEKVKNDKTI